MNEPYNKVTVKGLATLLAIIITYVMIFASFYPLSSYSNSPLLGVVLESPASLLNLVISILGFITVMTRRKEITAQKIVVSAVLASLVWLSVEYRYIYHGWVPGIPFFDPTINALEVFFIVLGFLSLEELKVPRFRLGEADVKQTGKSIVFGFILGVPFAIINLAFFVFIYGQQLGVENILYGCLRALQPGIMEEAVYRLFFMGVSIHVLERRLPKKTAAVSSIFMAVIFHSIPHVYQIILSDPIMAMVSVLVSSVLFGLPMAVLAYKRDIETSISFHWTIDAIRFILVG